MKKKENLLQKLLYFALGPLGGALIGFITIPITTWLVSPEQFGLTTMFTLLQTLLTSFIFLGLDQSFVREYNSYKGSKQNLLFNAILIPVGIALILMVIVLIFMKPISEYLFSEINILVMIALVIWIPFIVIERFLLLNIRMQEKGLQYSAFSILVKLTVMIATITLLLNFERTYTSIVLGAMIGQIFGNIILLITSRNLLRFNNIVFDKKLIKRMLHFGLPLLPAMMIYWVLDSTDRIALDYFSTLENIGIYFSAMKLISALVIVQTIFSNFWIPLSYRWHEDNVETKKFTQVSYLISCIMGCVFIGILLFKELAVWILSPEYIEAQYILPFLLFLPIMSTMSETTMLGISIERKTHWNIWITLTAATVNIILNILLVPYLGGIGAAIGTGTSYIVFFWTRTLISRKYWYKFNLFPYMTNTIILIVSATVNVVVKTNIIYIVNGITLIIFIGINIIFLSKVFDFKNIIKNKETTK